MFDLNGKVAIVTGANQGLGFAMCQGLAKAGADIFNIGRREDDHVIREAVEREGVKYHYYRADLSNEKNRERMLQFSEIPLLSCRFIESNCRKDG